MIIHTISLPVTYSFSTFICKIYLDLHFIWIIILLLVRAAGVRSAVTRPFHFTYFTNAAISVNFAPYSGDKKQKLLSLTVWLRPRQGASSDGPTAGSSTERQGLGLWI